MTATTDGTLAPPTVFLPVNSATPKDTVTQLEDKGWRGSMVDTYDSQTGVTTGEFGFGGDVYTDTIGYVLHGMMGDLSETGTTSVQHKFALLNSGQGQPKASCFYDNYSAGVRGYAGGQYAELDFTFSPDALLTYSAKASSFGSQTATVTVPSYSAVEALPAWKGVVSVGGTSYAEMTDASLNIKRQVTAVKTINNTQQPFVIWAGPISVSGKATLIMEDDTYLTKYLTGAKTSLEFSFTAPDATTIDFKMSKCSFSGADITRGKEYVELPISFKAHGNITDIGTSGGYGPLTVNLTNAIASGVY
jgi:hypothetical protein